MKVPDDFHTFVWDYFIDGPPKARPGPKPPETLLRNIIIKALVPVVTPSFGWTKPATRNATTQKSDRSRLVQLLLRK